MKYFRSFLLACFLVILPAQTLGLDNEDKSNKEVTDLKQLTWENKKISIGIGAFTNYGFVLGPMPSIGLTLNATELNFRIFDARSFFVIYAHCSWFVVL